MKISEIIPVRRSVRTYTGQPIGEANILKIKEFIAGLTPLFGAKFRIELITATSSAEPVKLGTYGFIKGASEYLALVVDGDGPLAEEAAAYAFEQVVLYCTSLGLGTCWLGGTFSRGDFTKSLKISASERVRIVSPVGFAAEKTHFLVSFLLGSQVKQRKPFEANFFAGNFSAPLSEAAAGVFVRPLEMVRLAPSASNKQPWRVVLEGSAGVPQGATGTPAAGSAKGAKLHFYTSPSHGFDRIDLGIALCHFGETCREMGIPGRWKVLKNAPESPQKTVYAVSWVCD